VAEREKSGALAVHGAYFDMANGGLFGLDETTREFMPVAPHAHARALAELRF